MSLVRKVQPRRHRRQSTDRPTWWVESPTGPIAFDRSIRTAEEIVGPPTDASALEHLRFGEPAGPDDPPDDEVTTVAHASESPASTSIPIGRPTSRVATAVSPPTPS